MRLVEFRLDGDVLTCDGARPRRLGDSETSLFDSWIKRYHALTEQPDARSGLLKLGSDIGAWLDGPERWIGALRDAPGAPVVAAFRVKNPPSADDRRFLEVPWEIAALNDEFLAAQPALMWAPLRRIGEPSPPLGPDHQHRLGVMFVAAAPYGQYQLDFEAEESAILHATRDTPMDLYVEDEGSLTALRTAWNNAKTLDVMHLSCHGLGGDEPFLALEDDYGDLKKASLGELAGAFVHRIPRLLFLSACHTGDGRAEVDSLALGLIQAGFPAVLGWADAVRDSDASRFAAALYEQAAQTGATILTAWAAARFQLMSERQRPAHWHLARLFLGPGGGGVLSAGDRLRISNDPDAGRKAIVEARGQRIEVASRYEFVGRRRELRTIRREFRIREHAGVLIYGQGRQGKSSLAARILDRHPHLKQVALYRACDGRAVLGAIADEVDDKDAAREIAIARKDYLDQLGPPGTPDDAAALRRTLRSILTGPCGSGGQPIVLVLDDFEALLDPPSGAGHWRVKPSAEPALAAVIRAFEGITTPSRLLITCRYDFPFNFEGRELGSRLLKVPLPPMSEADVLKQAARKLRAGAGSLPGQTNALGSHIAAAIAAARDNTGIRDMLFQAVLADAEAGARAIAQVDGYFSAGYEPGKGTPGIEDEQIRRTVEGLIIGTLVDMLTPDERKLLTASTLFRLPVPLAVWRRHLSRNGGGSFDRLLAFGLWDRFPDIYDRRQDATAINGIAATRIESASP